MTGSDFESLGNNIIGEHYRQRFHKDEVPGVPKEFDYVSEDGRIVGDAKYYTMVGGERLPPTKFSVIAEYVWLLGKCNVEEKFLLFGNDIRVPQKWLEKYGLLVDDVVFYYLDSTTNELSQLN